jgi:hypothetical protein
VAERRGPAGVEEQGTFIAGPPGTWEVLSDPADSQSYLSSLSSFSALPWCRTVCGLPSAVFINIKMPLN